MKRAEERVVNPTRYQVRREADGDLSFFRPKTNGELFETRAFKKHLVDAIHETLLNVGCVLQTMDTPDEDDNPLAYLLKELMDEAEDRIAGICRALEEEVGWIDVYISPGCGPIRRGDVLGVCVGGVTQ